MRKFDLPATPRVAPAPVAAKPAAPTLRERRKARALVRLAVWNRKLKLAQTKVRKLRRTIKYYEWLMKRPLP